MNRVIKFRAWNRMVERMQIFTLEDIEKQIGAIQWQNLDIMQFTGLTDSKGVEIYEGDILKWGTPPIEMEERIALVKIDPDIQLDCKNIKYPHVFHWGSFIYGEKDLTVIGNLFEHPNLLTK